MIFRIITLFPEFFDSPFRTGLLGKAVASGIIRAECADLRSYSDDKFRRCDDYPYGGGSGMVLLPGPLFRAVEDNRAENTKVVLTTPGGELLTQDLVKKLHSEGDLCIICGHYEGVDQRVIDRHVDYEISIGDYIVSGGEFAALVLIDAIARYVPGFMSNAGSLDEESFERGLLEYPQYTRPAEISGMSVPGVLLSGNHSEIRKWRTHKSIEKTRETRPDLYRGYILRKLLGEE